MTAVETRMDKRLGGDGASASDGSNLSVTQMYEQLNADQQEELREQLRKEEKEKRKLASMQSDYAYEMETARDNQGTYIASDPRFDRVWANFHMPKGQTTREVKSQMQGFIASAYGSVWIATDPSVDVSNANKGDTRRFKLVQKNELSRGTVIACPETGLHRMLDNGAWEDLDPPSPGELIEVGVDAARPFYEVPILDAAGNKQYIRDSAGKKIQAKNPDGSLKVDADDKPVYEMVVKRYPAMGSYCTTRTTSKFVYPASRGDYLIRYSKDSHGRYLNGDGEIIKIDDNGNYDPNGNSPNILRVKNDDFSFVKKDVPRDDTSPDGYTYYIQSLDSSYKPMMKGGKPIFLRGKARPIVNQEGIFTGTEISDPRHFLTDPDDATKGFLYDDHFCHNTKFVLKFKKEDFGGKPEPKKDSKGNTIWKKDSKGNAVYNSQGDREYEPLLGYNKIGDKMYLFTETRNFHSKSQTARSSLPNTTGSLKKTYSRYELQKDHATGRWLPIPEFALPKLGMEIALYDHDYNKVFKHLQGFLQPHHSDIQSDGTSEIGKGVLYHGRMIDYTTGKYMVKYLKPLGLVEDDFDVGGKFNNKAHDHSHLYNACKKTTNMEMMAEHGGLTSDNWLVLQREYALARCMGDYKTGMRRIYKGVVESSMAGTAMGAAAGVTAVAAGLATLPVAGIIVASALIAACAWNSCAYQYSRRRKDIVEQEEIDKKADTAQIFLTGTEGGKDAKYPKYETQIWGRKKRMSCLNFVGIKNDVFATIRGYLGAQYVWTGGVAGQSEMNDSFVKRLGLGIAGTTLAGGAVAGGAATAISAAVGISATVVAATMLLPAAGFFAFAGLSFVLLKFNELGKKHAEDMVKTFAQRKEINTKVFTDKNYDRRDDMHKVF